MLERISWELYLTTMGILLAVYYAALLIWHGIGTWKGSSRPPIKSPQPNLSIKADVPPPSPARVVSQVVEAAPTYQPISSPAKAVREDPLIPYVYDLTDELHAYFKQAGMQRDSAPVNESVRQIINKYPSLQGSTFQPELNELIKDYAMQECGVNIDTDLI